MAQIVSKDQSGAARHVRVGFASRQAVVAYIFLLPSLIYFSIFFFYPIGLEFWYSLHKDLVSNIFVGLENYGQAFADERVLHSFLVTAIFAFACTAFSIGLGLGLAVLVDMPLKGRIVFRAILLVPYLTSAVIVGLMWRNILDPLTGIFNRLLGQIGLPTQDWLSDYNAALWAIVGITIWQSIGYNMILSLAGLQGIPNDYHEAAKIDGANALNRFRFISIPLLAPTTLFVSIISVIGSLQAFTQAYIITKGGPAEATRFYVYHIYNVAFTENNFAYASALTFLMFLAILVLTIVQFRISRKGVEY